MSSLLEPVEGQRPTKSHDIEVKRLDDLFPFFVGKITVKSSIASLCIFCQPVSLVIEQIWASGSKILYYYSEFSFILCFFVYLHRICCFPSSET